MEDQRLSPTGSPNSRLRMAGTVLIQPLLMEVLMKMQVKNAAWRWVWSCALLMAAIVTFPLRGSAQAPAHAAQSSVVAKYIRAFRERDYKTIIDLDYSYQQGVADIKAQNPQVLWPRLLKNYYDTNVIALAKTPPQQIGLLQTLILPNTRWSITETRADHVQEEFGGYDRTIVYVSISYPSFDDSPFVDGKFLKETILQIDVNSKSQLVMKLARLPQGDTTWDPTPLMILNASWFADRLAGGLLRVRAIGGKAPFSWAAQCGSVNLADDFAKVDGLGMPVDQHSPELMVKLGSFPENLFPLHCVATVRDAGAQTETVGMTVPKMFTGVMSSYCWGRLPWSSRGQGLPELPVGSINCLAPMLAIETAGVVPVESAPRTGGGGQPGIPQPSPVAPAPPTSVAQPSPVTPASCGDYQSCFDAGRVALERSQWDSSLADFQKAASLEPSKPDPWAQLGEVYLATGQYQNAPAMWDKALGLGGTLAFGVWHYKPSRYERGTFHLGAKEVSFVVPSQEGAFSVAPAEVSSVKSHHPPLAREAWSFGMNAGGHNYWFSYVPLGVQCVIPVRCSDPAGYRQEEAVANYVAQTIPKLASGAFGKPTSSSSLTPTALPSSTPKGNMQPTPSQPSGCNRISNPVVPNACLGEFRHGTLVTKDQQDALVLAASSATPVLTHPGVDLVAECGSPIQAFADGVVADVIDKDNDPDFKYLGYMVLLDHSTVQESGKGKQTYTIYLHMEHPPKVKLGESVKGGSELGWVGKTGAAWGCHTHFEIRHFQGRYLRNPAWNSPFNIYGRGDQRGSTVFQQSWDNPERVFANPGANAPKSTAFGFANSDGAALLSVGTTAGVNTSPAKPTEFDAAICSDNLVVSISFDRHQEPGPNDNGRDWAQNFDQHGGDRFRVVDGRTPADGSCLLTQRAFLSGMRLLRVTKDSKAAPCDAQTISQLAAGEKRGVRFCRRFGTVEPGGQLLAVEFDRQGNDLLAGVALKIGGQIYVDRIPAKYDAGSGWRVGDQGHLFDYSQDASFLDIQVVNVFSPLFAFKDDAMGVVELGILWAGEEGLNLMLLSASRGKLQEVAKGYRYMAPI